MKLKKRYIVILLLIIFISIAGFILKNKNIQISSIFKKEYGAGTKVTFNLSSQYKCASSDYKSLTGLTVNEQVNSGETTHYFQVIPASETNWDGGGQYVFMYNGCPWGADAFVLKYNELTGNANVCSNLKTKAASDFYMQDIYNESICVVEKNIEYEGTTQSYSSFGYEEQYASYGTGTGVLEKKDSCDAYYNNYSTDTANMYFSEKIGTTWFQILKTENYTNKTGDAYTDVFLINGCATTMDDFLSRYKNASGNYSVCSSISSLVDLRNQDWFNGHFNKSACVTSEGYAQKSVTYECSIGFWENSQMPAFLVFGQPWDLESYLTTAGCSCESVKPYITSLEQQSIYKTVCGENLTYNESNVCDGPVSLPIQGKINNYYYLFGRLTTLDCKGWGCDAAYDPDKTGKRCMLKDSTGYLMVNGCSASGYQYFTECPNSYGENVCTNEVKTFLEEHYDIEKIQEFNNYCGSTLGKIETTTITLNWQGGWGPSTLGDNWGGENGIYTVQGVTGKTHTFEFDAILHYYNHNLIGWSTSPECNTKIGSGGKNHTFTFGSSDITYYACYDGDIYEGTLFNADGSKKTGTTTSEYVQDSCDDSETVYNNVTSVPMKLMSRYTISSYERITVDNPYCNVLCTDTVDVYYPNIFETIPAGQYFELMYEPEIQASRVCQSEFNFTNWNTAYDNALTAELAALDAYEKAKASYEAADALSPTSSGSCGCCCSGPDCSCSGSCKTYYYDSETEYYYNTNDNRLSQTQTFSACGSTDTSSIVSSASLALSTARTNYAKAVNERLKLEKYNMQCYTVLDSTNTNTDTLTYTDIFNDNYDTIDELDPTYNVETAKVDIGSNYYGTQSTYSSYITSTTNSLSGTNKITNNNLTTYANGYKTGKNTKNFYALYPELTFTYDTGSEGSPKNNASSNFTDTLLTESHIKEDTGSYTLKNVDGTYNKEQIKTNYSRTFTLNAVSDGKTRGTYINFNAYFNNANKNTYRTVKYYFLFHEGTEFYSSLQSGNYSNKTHEITSPYISLSKQTYYTKLNGTKLSNPIENHVYPVSLKAVTGDYANSFSLKDQKETYLKDNFNFTGTTNYTCSYEITNDALILSEETGDYKDLKSNTIFRSVATDDIDPNKRAETGNLGENWTNEKGKKVQELIKYNEKHGSTVNDTYNPDNLEYSFTLTPALIQEIQDYNDTTNYDDFNLTCATEDGRECISEFLTDLSDGKVGSYTYSNYSSINSFDSYELSQRRKKWKYYIPSFTETTSLSSQCQSLGYNIYECNKGKMSLENYTTLYEKWGVLP